MARREARSIQPAERERVGKGVFGLSRTHTDNEGENVAFDEERQELYVVQGFEMPSATCRCVLDVMPSHCFTRGIVTEPGLPGPRSSIRPRDRADWA